MPKALRLILQIDPIPVLLAKHDPALTFFVRRDLLQQTDERVAMLWSLPEATGLLRKQQPNGSWCYPQRQNHPAPNTNYNLLETYRSLRILVEMYGLNREHPAIGTAAEFIFSCQTEEGDIRGVLGNQFMPYYHAALLEELIKCGYAQDNRVLKGLQWLLSMRQEDGGWIIPIQNLPSKQKTARLWEGTPVYPDRTRPHSHLATGMILRAFAAHPEYRHLPEIQTAGGRLKERFFQADKYHDRKAPSYWLKFQFPFWWPNLLTGLDSLYWLGFDLHDNNIARGLDWFLKNQANDGLWETGYGSGKNARRVRAWVGLAICRMLQGYLD